MLIELLLFILLLLSYMVYRFVHKLYYWQNLGIPSPSPRQQLQFMYQLIGRKRALHDIKKEEYGLFEGERFYGTFDGTSHIFVFRDDFHLLRSVMIKDFDSFGKGIGANFVVTCPANYVEEIQMKAITVIYGDEWKAVRYIT